MTQGALLLLDTRMPYGSLSVGCEEHLDPAGTGSFYNEGEADIVVQHVISLLYSGIIQPPVCADCGWILSIRIVAINRR